MNNASMLRYVHRFIHTDVSIIVIHADSTLFCGIHMHRMVLNTFVYESVYTDFPFLDCLDHQFLDCFQKKKERVFRFNEGFTRDDSLIIVTRFMRRG